MATIVGLSYHKKLLMEGVLHFGVHMYTALAFYVYFTLLQ